MEHAMLRWMITALAALICVGCGTARVEYVPVEKVKTEYRDVMRMDSVYIRDSVTVTAKGDTVIRDRWRTEYRDRWRRDTITRTDTVPMPIPVERKLSRWEQAKMDYGGHALTTVAVTILIVVGQTVYKLKKG